MAKEKNNNITKNITKKVVVELDINLWRELQYHKITEECSFKSIVNQALVEFTEKYVKIVPNLVPTKKR